jgi:hypothetical protein
MDALDHNAFATSLADYLKTAGPRRRLTWENITFNCGDGADAYSCRPDVFSIVPALDPQHTRPWTCEVKVSRADFLSDVRSEKWKRYRRFSCRIWFAAPEQMIRPNELPEGVGLLEFRKPEWVPVVRPKFCKGWELSGRDLMRLILGKWGTYADRLEMEKAA